MFLKRPAVEHANYFEKRLNEKMELLEKIFFLKIPRFILFWNQFDVIF